MNDTKGPLYVPSAAPGSVPPVRGLGYPSVSGTKPKDDHPKGPLIRALPGAFRKEGWEVAARHMEIWLAGGPHLEGREEIYEGNSLPAVEVQLSWYQGFARAKRAWDDIAKLAAGELGDKPLEVLAGSGGVSAGVRSEIDAYSSLVRRSGKVRCVYCDPPRAPFPSRPNARQPLYVAKRSVAGLALDDLTAALNSHQLRLYVTGEGTARSDGGIDFTVEGFWMRVFDTFDFVDRTAPGTPSQYLGAWTAEGWDWSTLPNFALSRLGQSAQFGNEKKQLTNSDFIGYRRRLRAQGDLHSATDFACVSRLVPIEGAHLPQRFVLR